MDFSAFVEFVQKQFSDGLVLVVGSGLSAAEGIPGMGPLAQHLERESSSLRGEDAELWGKISSELGNGLESALLKYPPTSSLETWIIEKTTSLLLPKEREVLAKVVKGEQVLRLTRFLAAILKPPAGLPILTPNYDRLVEVGCEMAGLHVDTTAIGEFAGKFNHIQSAMASCKGIRQSGKTAVLEHYQRAIVLKPHGSFDWYRTSEGPRRCVIDLEMERLIITPGLNKYKAGYDPPFDKHREIANDYIKKAARFLVVGYGFNDDHLQHYLVERIKSGTPTLILTLAANDKINQLATESPNCLCVSKPPVGTGMVVRGRNTDFTQENHEYWDLGVLTRELLQ